MSEDLNAAQSQPCGEASADAEVVAGQQPEPSVADTLHYAQEVAGYAAAKYGPPKGWAALETIYGCLMQIDNALTGLQRKPCEHVWFDGQDGCANCGAPREAASPTTISQDRLADPLPTGERDGWREKIARIIEPDAWRWLDRGKYQRYYEIDREDSLAKADAILALTAPIVGGGDRGASRTNRGGSPPSAVKSERL